MDLFWKLFAELFQSEAFKALVVLCIIVTLGYVGRELRRLREDFTSHVSEEGVTLAQMSAKIDTIKGNDLHHLAQDVKSLQEDIRLITQHLMGKGE